MIRAGLWAMIGTVVNQGVRLAVVIILARLLTPEAFGIVAATQVIFQFSEVFVRFGVGPALIQTDQLTRRMERTATTLMLGMAIVFGGAFIVLAPTFGRLLNVPQMSEIMPVMVFAFVVSAGANAGLSLLTREMRFRRLAMIEIGSSVIGYAPIAIGLAWAGMSYWSLVLATTAQATFLAVGIFASRPVPPTFDLRRSDLSPLMRFGGGVLLSQIFNTIALKGDNMVVSATLGVGPLGYYSRAYALMDTANSVAGTVFYKVLFPAFAKQRGEGQDMAARANAFYMSHAVSTLVIVPLMAFMCLMAGPLVELLLGPQWAATTDILKIFSLGMFFRLAYKVSGAFVIAEGAVYRGAWRQFVYALLVIGGAFLGSRYGLEGVAVAVLIALWWQFASLTNLSNKLVGATWRGLLLYIWPFLAAGAVAYALTPKILELITAVDAGPAAELALAGIILLVIYGITLALMWRARAVGAIIRYSVKKLRR